MALSKKSIIHLGVININNDRLSHWLAGVVSAWVIAFGLLGIPIFHLLFGISLRTVIYFVLAAGGVQVIVTPWLFSARSSSLNPAGLPLKRRITVVIWLCLTALIFSYFVFRGAGADPEAKTIFVITVLAAGVMALVAIVFPSQRNKLTIDWSICHQEPEPNENKGRSWSVSNGKSCLNQESRSYSPHHHCN